MPDGALGVLACAHDRDSRQDWVRREGGNDRSLNVKTILQQRDGSVTGSDSVCDHFCHRGRNIGDILSSNHHEVEWRQGLRLHVGYRVADWEKGEPGPGKVAEEHLLVVGRQPLTLPCSREWMSNPCSLTTG